MTTLGMSSTGKTSIIMRLLTDRWGRFDATIGASFATYVVDEIKYEIWDTAGNERFRSLLPMYYRSTDLMLMVFDLSNLDTINNLAEYLEGIMKTVKNEYRIIVVANKSDLIKGESYDKIVSDAERKVRALFYTFTDPNIRIHTFVTVSAKDGTGFDDVRVAINTCGSEMKAIKSGKNSSLDAAFTLDTNETRQTSYTCGKYC